MGKGLDIQISANGSYRKMNKDGKAWTARLSHVVYRMTPTTLERPYLNPDWVEWLMGFPRNCVGTIEIPSALPLPTPDVSVNTRKGVVVNYAPCDVAI